MFNELFAYGKKVSFAAKPEHPQYIHVMYTPNILVASIVHRKMIYPLCSSRYILKIGRLHPGFFDFVLRLSVRCGSRGPSNDETNRTSRVFVFSTSTCAYVSCVVALVHSQFLIYVIRIGRIVQLWM